MRVWLITGEYPPMRGGIADHTHQLAQELSARGHEVAVITSHEAGPLRPAAHRTWDPSQNPVVFPVVQDWGFGVWYTLRQLAAIVPPDVAHLQYQAAAYGMELAANLIPWWLARLGIPTVTTMHDLRVPYLFPKAGRARQWAIDRLLRDSAAVIVTNPQDRNEAAARRGGSLKSRQDEEPAHGELAEPRAAHPSTSSSSGRAGFSLLSRLLPAPEGGSLAPLRFIPLTVQVPCCPPPDYARATWRARHGLDDGPVVAHFGMLNHTKGVDVLFRAVAQVRAQGVPMRLLMAGEDVGASDPVNVGYREELRRLADALGIGAALVWTGYLAPQELSAALRSADVAALPFADGASYRRGSLLIVLAHSLPLVTTYGSASTPDVAGGLPVLRDGENCLLTPPGDDRALAAALLRLWEDAPLREGLGAAASQTASVFTWERVAPATIHVYGDVVDRRSRR